MDSLIHRKNYWAKHFSDLSVRYPEDPAKALDFSNERLMGQVHDLILKALEFDHGMKILDAGCGLGNLVEKIGRDLRCNGKRIEVYGIDISFGMLKRAKAKGLDILSGLDFFLMDMINLGFKDNSFDCSVCSEALQYTDPYMALEELIRVTKYQLIISVPNFYNSIIQRAIKRNMGRYVGIRIEHLIDHLKSNGKCEGIQVYPLIFSDDQRKHPYREMAFSEYDKLPAIQKSDANRFIIKIRLE